MNQLKIFFLLVVLVAAFFLDIAFGQIPIPIHTVVRIFMGHWGGNESWHFIIHEIRIPKALTAVIAGCGLAVSGLQMQTLFRNPLAGPSILGVSSGASLGVALVMLTTGSVTSIYTIKALGITGSWIIIFAAASGAAAVMLLVMLISTSIRNHVLVLIVGVMIGNITYAIVSIWQYFSSPELIRDYLLWTFGSLSGVTGIQLIILGFTVLCGILISFSCSKMLDALMLGTNYARSLGVTILRARWMVIGSTSLLAGAITAFCGPVGFIGIAVPHLARAFFQTSGHRTLIPACCLIGAILVLICDLMSQLPGTQTVLPINVITALIGGPVVIWVIAGPYYKKRGVDASS